MIFAVCYLRKNVFYKENGSNKSSGPFRFGKKRSTKTSETSNKYLFDEQAFNKVVTTSVQYYKSSENMTVVSVWNRLCLTQGLSLPLLVCRSTSCRFQKWLQPSGSRCELSSVHEEG